MESIHEMKTRLAMELEETCEKMLHKPLTAMELKMLKLTSETVLSLHDACRMIKRMGDHEGKSMDEHYK